MRRIIVSASILAVLLSVFTSVAFHFPINAGNAFGSVGTQVGGIIWDNTTWTSEGSPYFFVDDVTVARNATLTIKPGAVLNLDLWSLKIDGTLSARGNQTQRIIFQGSVKPLRAWPPRIFFNNSEPWNESSGTGCIFEYAEINVTNYQYETILGGSPKISNNLIFNYGNDAAAIRTNGIVTNNTIMGGYRGIVAENGTILQNIVKDATVGIGCGFSSIDPIYHPTIIGNLIMNNSAGIVVSSCSPYITNNTIMNNTYGIRFDSYAFSRNAVPVGILYNNIHSNNYAVFVEYEDPRITINMTYNWWGTIDSSLISQKIWDQNDNRRFSLVKFEPFLSSPAFSENIIPEFQPSLILFIFAGLTLVVVALKKK